MILSTDNHQKNVTVCIFPLKLCNQVNGRDILKFKEDILAVDMIEYAFILIVHDFLTFLIDVKAKMGCLERHQVRS